MEDFLIYSDYDSLYDHYDDDEPELVPFYFKGKYIGEITRLTHNFQLIECIKAFELDLLGEFIRRNESLNDQTRRFIADVIEGKIKRLKGRPKDKRRDYLIATYIELLILQGKNLTSNSKESGAAFITGKMYGIEEDAAIKAYQRMKSRLEEDRVEREWNGRNL